jgi:acyl phosphate:glycerol-3-phosphate acyltransferase
MSAVAGAYLWGAIPTSYLVARFQHGIDIREVGSGNVGSSNLMKTSGWKMGVLIGMFDSLVKGMIPILIAKWLGADLWTQAAMGIALVAGHNWTPYLRFTGGRGVATTIGVVMGLLMWKEYLLLAVVMGGLGRLLIDDMSSLTLVALILLPILALVFGQPAEVVYASVGMSSLLLIKRLTGNFERPVRDGQPLYVVLVCRAIWDRDVRDQKAWMLRNLPGGSPPDAPTTGI